MGLFSRKPSPERAQAPAQPRESQPAAAAPVADAAPAPAADAAQEQLPSEGPLRRLVDHLLVDDVRSAKLTLVQRGSTMNYQTERAGLDSAADTDAGVIDQASPLFDDVAALYTESMNSATGAWQTVVIAAGDQKDGAREVTVDYDFPSAEHRTERYRIGSADAAGRGTSEQTRSEGAESASAGSAAAGAAAGTSAAVAGSGSGSAASASSRGAEAQSASEQRFSDDVRADRRRESSAFDDEPAAQDRSSQDRAAQDRTGQSGAAQSATAQDRTDQASSGQASAQQSAGTSDAPLDPVEAERVPEGQLTEDRTVDNLAPRQQGQEPIEVDPEVQRIAAQTTGHQSAAGSGTGEQIAGGTGAAAASSERSGAQGTESSSQAQAPSSSPQPVSSSQPASQSPSASQLSQTGSSASGQDLPAHVDHDEWQDDLPAGRSAGAAPTGAAAARSVSRPADVDAPTLASSADVAPSYRAAENQAAAGDALAPGNRVLTQQEVARRTADAQQHLFGREGTARDVSTVLIRVRTLGTYYDALTHVRQGGFWDQRATFDLVPEELLQVQSLKQDSYVEGEGAPLAIMFRFRAGLPPEVSFDYDDEEAFVRYENRLPSQNFVEELRMYPRTGSAIPQHISDALQDWNY